MVSLGSAFLTIDAELLLNYKYLSHSDIPVTVLRNFVCGKRSMWVVASGAVRSSSRLFAVTYLSNLPPAGKAYDVCSKQYLSP